MRKLKTIYYACIGLVLVGCAKDQNFSAEISSTVVSSTSSSATIDIVVSGQGDGKISQSGVVFSFTPSPDIENLYGTCENCEITYQFGYNYLEVLNSSSSSTSIEITGIPGNSRFYYKPFCVISGQEYLGTLDSFVTDCPSEITCGPGGGIVFYDDGNGGGLEVAPFDAYINSTYDDYYIDWGCSTLSIPGTDSIVGSGAANTALIIGACTEQNSAADVCSDFTYGGYSDWYLPSESELKLIYTEVHLLGFGNFSTSNYWSSTENAFNGAQAIDFNSGNALTLYKHNDNRVRPVRTF
jgi:hypothetical protein